MNVLNSLSHPQRTSQEARMIDHKFWCRQQSSDKVLVRNVQYYTTSENVHDKVRTRMNHWYYSVNIGLGCDKVILRWSLRNKTTGSLFRKRLFPGACMDSIITHHKHFHGGRRTWPCRVFRLQSAAGYGQDITFQRKNSSLSCVSQ